MAARKYIFLNTSKKTIFRNTLLILRNVAYSLNFKKDRYDSIKGQKNQTPTEQNKLKKKHREYKSNKPRLD